MIFTIITALNFKIEQINIKTAFLYKVIDKEIYIKQPTGLKDRIKRVCLLKKVLYRLK